jgi:predicted MFS family arabinose efflux permease
MFVNPIACALLLPPVFRLVEGDRIRRRLVNFDAAGAALVTGGMLLLVYGLVRAPIEGWASARTIGVLVGAAVVLAAFVANERRQRAPLAPLSIFRINGLGFSNVTQLVAFAGFLALFFYVTLYMQNILGYSAVQTGLAYLPLCGIAVVSAGISSQLLGRVGTRPVIVVGAVIGAAGLYWLSRISVGGSYTTDLLPGLLLVGLGIAGLFVAVATAANAGVPADKAGLAAALLNASQWLGGALGLAIFTAVSTSRTNHLLAAGEPSAHALTSGFQRALLVGSIFILASAVIALRATNTRGETAEPEIEAEPEASLAA